MTDQKLQWQQAKIIAIAPLSGRININEDYEVRYWTQEFECTAIELRNAVRVVGAMVSNVRWYLQRQKG